MSDTKKDKILIIYSCNQKNAFLQQNIVIINHFICELEDKYDILILSSRDTLKLFVPENIKVIVDNISCCNIMKIIKKEKIYKIIPIDNFDLFKKNNFNSKKIDIFFSSFIRNKNNNENFFKKKAESVGMLIKNASLMQKKSYNICFVAINDNYGNQIILDSFEKIIDNGNVIYCSNISIDISLKRKINKFVNNFGSLLEIKNFPYALSIIIDNNHIVYDSICYGISDELIFSLQRQNINIVKIMLKIVNKIPIFFQKKNDLLVISNNYSNDFCMYYIDDIYNLNTYDKFQNKLFFLNCQEDEFTQITDLDVIYDDFFLVSIGDDLSDDINNQLFFCKISNILSDKIKKKPLILTKKILPIFQLIKNANVVLCDVFDKKNVHEIIKRYNINEAYITNTSKNSNLLKMLQKFNVKIISHQNNNIAIYDTRGIIKACKKTNNLFRFRKNSSAEKSIYFSCVVDCYKNIVFSSIIDANFNCSENIFYYKSPATMIHYDLYNNINDIVLNIVSKEINTYGLLTIVFIYKDGDLYVNNIILNKMPLMLFLNKTKINDIYEAIANAMLGKNIKSFIKKDDCLLPKFYNKICFEYQDKQIVEIEGIKEKDIFKKNYLINNI